MLPTVSSLEVVRFPVFHDTRGVLVPVELKQYVSFPVARLFFISGVPKGQTRGAHAHRHCHQFLIGVVGRTTVLASDGATERLFRLDAGTGLHIPPLIFASENYEDDVSVLAVCCDQEFDSDDYIDDLEGLLASRADSELARKC